MTRCLLSTDELARRYALGEPLDSICRDAGITRTGVWKRLRAAGVPRERRAGPRAVKCAHCGAIFQRSRHRTMRAIRSFCSSECYRAWVSVRGANWRPWRHGQRLARLAAAQHATIPPGAVVHHIDGDNRNNHPGNLMVFASQADHMRHHRGGRSEPIWDGRQAKVALSAQDSIENTKDSCEVM